MKKMILSLSLIAVMPSFADDAADWKNVISAFQTSLDSAETQKAVDEAIVALQNVFVVTTKQAHQSISDAEKQKLAALIVILKNLLTIAPTQARIGEFRIDESKQDEFNQLLSELLVIGGPLYMQLQDPSYVTKAENSQHKLLLRVHEEFKKTLEQLSQIN